MDGRPPGEPVTREGFRSIGEVARGLVATARASRHPFARQMARARLRALWAHREHALAREDWKAAETAHRRLLEAEIEQWRHRE